jgi:hypothetical protein
MGFGFVIGFIEHLQFIIDIKYRAIPNSTPVVYTRAYLVSSL